MTEETNAEKGLVVSVVGERIQTLLKRHFPVSSRYSNALETKRGYIACAGR
jgi:hypothetical protein